jgi:site-specific recombinase XerD
MPPTAIRRPQPRAIAGAEPDAAPSDAFHDLRAIWFRALGNAGRSQQTIDSYEKITNGLFKNLTTNGLPSDPEKITRDSLEMYFEWLRTRGRDEGGAVAPATRAIRFRSLHAFFAWLSDDDPSHIQYVRTNPMARMARAKIPPAPPPVLTDEDVAKLLEQCRGRSFEDRRDRAIIQVLRWTGMRIGELVSMLYTEDTMDLNERTALITGKSGTRKTKWAPEAAAALDAYLYMRDKHPDADLEELWLVRRGPKTKHGAMDTHAVQQMLRRRAAAAGIHVHAHQFRHTLAHNWMRDRRGDEQNLISLLGWAEGSAAVMLRRYGGAARQERAMDAYDEWAQGRSKRRK